MSDSSFQSPCINLINYIRLLTISHHAYRIHLKIRRLWCYTNVLIVYYVRF